MLKFVTITLAVAATLISATGHADLTEGGKYQDITRLNHPLAKSLVAIKQIGSTTTHLGNGFFWGPNGCYVVTNFHVAFSNGLLEDGTHSWVYTGGSNFVRNAKKHRVQIKADLDPSTGQFRRTLEGRVIRYGAYDRTPNAVNQAGDDIAVLKLYEAGTDKEACLGEDFLPKQAREHALFRDGILSDLNVIHLFQTGENTARVFVNTQDCKSSLRMTGGGTTATCELRNGASGSILFQTIAGSSVPVIGLAAAGSKKEQYMTAANIGALNRNLRLGLESEGVPSHIIADFLGQQGTTTAAAPAESTTR